jgi:hypothetical protein
MPNLSLTRRSDSSNFIIPLVMQDIVMPAVTHASEEDSELLGSPIGDR